MKQRTAIALSGGVDSAVAAALALEHGDDVFAVTMPLWRMPGREGGGDELAAAARVAAALGITHHVVDLAAAFEAHVVDYVAAEYAAGRTPAPCAVCNRRIKFGLLLDAARGLGADRMATGHYARVARTPDGTPCLQRGADRSKDQSYFLFDLSPAQLQAAWFPLGDSSKDDTRGRARQLALPVDAQRESQDLCFAGPGQHAEITAQRRPGDVKSGDIVYGTGAVLGRHEGIHRFTIGQRRGLGVAGGKPLFVIGIDAASGRITVGPRDAAMRRSLRAERVRWTGTPPPGPVRCRVQIRSNHDDAPAQVVPGPDNTADVRFDTPQFAVTPGQAAVFYHNDLVIGGGWIAAADDRPA